MNYDELIADSVQQIAPSGIRKFFDIVQQMKHAISLGVGEPDFVTPWSACEAAIQSIQEGETHYTGNRGLPELCQLVARYLSERFDIAYDPADEIMITLGASEGIDLALRALINPGDEILVPEPSYVSYMPCTQLAGGVAVGVPTHAQDGFRLRAHEVQRCITPRTKALVLPYPNNPTGGIMTDEDLRPIAQLAKAHRLLVISDEIYAELTYGRRHVSIASLPGMWERTIVLNGFSKAFAMTGWRLGYVAAPAPLLAAMLKIHQYTALCAPIMAQYAGICALQKGLEDGFADVTHMTSQYDARRKLMVEGFNDMGLTCFDPQGAFYVFASIQKTGLTSEAFAQRLLTEHEVAVVPGTAFTSGGEGFIRCCYAASSEQIREALIRMRRFMQAF